MEADDFASVNRVLATLNWLFKKFCRSRNVTDHVRLDLKYCFDNFCDPLLKTVQIISGKINNSAAAAEAQLLCFRMFYSLNFIDGFFVKPVDKWMNEFKNYLTLREEDQVVGAHELQSAVLENIGLYIKKKDQPFQNYFRPFLDAVVGVLLDDPKPLTSTAIKFLETVVVSTGLFFQDDHILQQIMEKVVVPNMMLGDDDEELFQKDYLEFIRRDMDPNSRRMITFLLLKGIASSSYKIVIRELIQNWLALFAENPTTNWKYKDCAISLVISFKTHETLSTPIIVDVEGFFRSAIVPELQSHDVNSFPILKAAALKFFTKFRFHIPRPIVMDLVGDVVRFLGSDANVVHSYAAISIKTLLHDGWLEASFAPDLLENLFDALKKRGSEENKYVMHCIMQVGAISPCIIISTTSVVIINRFCENPKHPDRLFEAFDYLVTRSYKDHVSLVPASLVPALDIWILPSVRMILDKHVTEFFPYALRLLARLMDFKTCFVPPRYKRSIFDILNMLIIQVLLG